MNRVEVSLIVFALALILAGLGFAKAHDAPSGWSYPAACCSSMDCYPIGEEEVQAAPGGAFRIVRTGEVFHHPDARGLTDADRRFRWSGDAQFHRCSPSGQQSDATSFCLIVPQPGV